MKIAATTSTAVLGFSILSKVHTRGNITNCFYEKNSLKPSFSYDFGNGNIYDIPCSDSCSCNGSGTGYTGCHLCCCGHVHKKTIRGKKATILPFFILPLATDCFTRLLLFLVPEELDLFFYGVILPCLQNFARRCFCNVSRGIANFVHPLKSGMVFTKFIHTFKLISRFHVKGLKKIGTKI